MQFSSHPYNSLRVFLLSCLYLFVQIDNRLLFLCDRNLRRDSSNNHESMTRFISDCFVNSFTSPLQTDESLEEGSVQCFRYVASNATEIRLIKLKLRPKMSRNSKCAGHCERRSNCIRYHCVGSTITKPVINADRICIWDPMARFIISLSLWPIVGKFRARLES